MAAEIQVETIYVPPRETWNQNYDNMGKSQILDTPVNILATQITNIN